MNNNLLKTLKHALVRMHKTFTGETLKTDSNLQYITIEGKKRLFNKETMEFVKEEIAEACRDSLNSRNKIIQ